MEIKAALPSVMGGNYEIAALKLRDPGPDEVLVRIVACGVCHTDIAMKNTRGLMVLGHEGSGVVEAVGTGITDIKVEDHVVLSYPYCGTCGACQDNRPYDCARFSELFMGDRIRGTRPLRYNGRIVTSFFGQGSFATHTVVHKSSVIKVDKELDLKLLGPLGCCIQTGAGAVINYLKARPGKPIAVFGTGSVGLSALLAARAIGCAPIIAVERVPERLELAKKFGATHTINNEKSRDLKRDIIHLSGGLKYALDTTGDTHLMELTVTCLLPGGKGCGVAGNGVPRLDSEGGCPEKKLGGAHPGLRHTARFYSEND